MPSDRIIHYQMDSVTFILNNSNRMALKQELFNKTIYNNNNKEKKTQWGKKRNTSPPIKVFFFFGWLLFLTCFRFL